MCLILWAYQQHPDYPLIVAANRDEFYGRPTAQADFWTDHAHVLAGRDLQANGTWMGVTTEGKWASLTNVREANVRHQTEDIHEAPKVDPNKRSRGELVADYLCHDQRPVAYLQSVREKNDQYEGFNLIVADTQGIHVYSNRRQWIQTISSGIYGLSNAYVDTPWPKIQKGKAGLENLMHRSEKEMLIDGLFGVLADAEPAADHLLPDTGVSQDLERRLSSLFIQADGGYGTCSSTVYLVDSQGKITFEERSYLPQHQEHPHKRFTFAIQGLTI